ncbi:MAG: M48 family metallopeptidase [Methanosarcinales archaeon]|nr:M48 family metallopeptidase [Methanosarcinales archaeon]
MDVKIIRSQRRKKTIQAKMVEGTLVVYLPAGMHPDEERKHIETMKDKVEKKRLKQNINKTDYLGRRFDEMNKEYFQGKLEVNSIKFVTNQEKRRGSCTPGQGTIRISHKIADMPKWVLDYVIMHEMTHLVHPDHSRRFWDKVNEYKYTERARGFLIAKEMDEDGERGIDT